MGSLVLSSLDIPHDELVLFAEQQRLGTLIHQFPALRYFRRHSPHRTIHSYQGLVDYSFATEGKRTIQSGLAFRTSAILGLLKSHCRGRGLYYIPCTRSLTDFLYCFTNSIHKINLQRCASLCAGESQEWPCADIQESA